MRLHNAIRNVENAIATQKATPPDTDPMLKSRALESGFVTLVGKQDVLVKMLNAAAMCVAVLPILSVLIVKAGKLNLMPEHGNNSLNNYTRDRLVLLGWHRRASF